MNQTISFFFFHFYYYWQAICAAPYCSVFRSRTLRTNNNSLLFMITHIIVLVDLFELWIHARSRTQCANDRVRLRMMCTRRRENGKLCAVCSLVARSPWARAWSVCAVRSLLIHNNVNTMLGHVLRLQNVHLCEAFKSNSHNWHRFWPIGHFILI